MDDMAFAIAGRLDICLFAALSVMLSCTNASPTSVKKRRHSSKRLLLKHSRFAMLKATNALTPAVSIRK
jgi:hypothetical protein